MHKMRYFVEVPHLVTGADVSVCSSFNNTILQSFIISYFGFRFNCAYN